MFIGESTKSGTDEGPQLDVPETETKAPKRRPKSKRGEEKSEGEEEILQLGKIAGSPQLNFQIFCNIFNFVFWEDVLFFSASLFGSDFFNIVDLIYCNTFLFYLS